MNCYPKLLALFALIAITCNHQVLSIKEQADHEVDGLLSSSSMMEEMKKSGLRAKSENKILLKKKKVVENKDPSSSDRSLSAISSSMQQMLDLINNERRKNGRSELCFNDKLILAAQRHNNDMIQQNYFSHTGADGSSLSTRVDRVGYNWYRVAENIAINTSVQRAHGSLMGSAGHRRNILNSDLKQIGLGIAIQTSGKWNGYMYVTQVFAASNVEGCSSGRCNDKPGWYDSDGPAYDCDWYASDASHCVNYGAWFRNFGMTANDACCVCGGGSN